jgi:AraC-like DNA-binding protein
MTTMFQSRLDVSDGAGPETGAILLAQIQDYIERNLSDPDLTPSRIAAEQYVSLRQVHHVFQQNGLTVSSWIRGRRLERCRRDLVDRSPDPVPVAAVGLRWGFKTASHFGRIFKDTYGMTPAEFRRAAIAD